MAHVVTYVIQLVAGLGWLELHVCCSWIQSGLIADAVGHISHMPLFVAMLVCLVAREITMIHSMIDCA